MKCLEQIDQLRESIKSGNLAPGDMVGTEFAFSQEWGLARNTVRKGIEVLVDEGLLERRPGKGLFVRSPHSATRTVQVIVPNLAWSHQVKIARGAQEAGREHGVQTLVYDAHGQLEADLEMIRRLPDSPIDGAIIVSLHHRRFSEVLYELKAGGYPFVLVDQRLHDLEVPTVEENNYEGGYMVGKYLAALGHKRAAFLGPLNFQVITERLNGFRDAMLDAGVLFDRSLVMDLGGESVTEWMNERIDKTEEVLLPLLAKPNRPTAVFDASGDIAPFIYRTAQRAELKIPEDVSVVSFDESPISCFLQPEVARVKHLWEEIGQAAFELLMKQMNPDERRRTARSSEHRVMPVGWDAGKSLAAVEERRG
ncbi:MAG: GntR family transcriptional regulator [Pirellulales bacterium]|nr:GntR family transcriptional regulator [Pirellulales bacterium]